MRRRMHSRRSNASLGVCAVDLSGPHEQTPRPGSQIAKDPCRYFLALSVRPDLSTEICEIAVQTGNPDEPDNQQVARTRSETRPVLIYAALLGTKSEAPRAIQHLMAHINNDNASFPTEILFRLHSDQGTEFVNDDLTRFCEQHGIHKTTTAGYDPNANSAESTVGTLKRRARYLLSGARLPTNWWGVATLAAAQLCRADAGLEEYPRIPFGTRVMIVRNPTPANAFLPRAEPATVFGPSSSVPHGFWTYQKVSLNARPMLQLPD